ncbi:MAG: hypothetical protein ACKVE4_00995 [Dissulfuribacterales bacterium]
MGKKDSVNFEYKVLPTYNAYAVSGVHGGLNASGEIVANFFHERSRIPKTQRYNITEDGQLIVDPDTPKPNDAIIRNILFSISINPNTARSVGQWFIDRADEHQNILEKQTQGKQK